MRFLFAVIPAVALLAQSQTPPDARRLLMRSGGPVLMADTVRLAGKVTSDIVAAAGRQRVEASFTILRSSGERMRLEGKSGGSTILQVSDGTNKWTYQPATGTYTQIPIPRGPEANDEFSRLKFSRDPAGFSKASVEREERLEFGGKAVPCYVVRAVYASMPGDSAARDVVRTVWISQADDLILRDTWEFSRNSAATAQGKRLITTDYTVIEWGMPLSDDLFVFHPPEGSHLGTGGSPAGVAAFSSGRALAGNSVVLRKVQPEYTAEARAAGIQGTVSLYVEVNPDGKPINIQVMQGLGLGLDEKAVEALKQWEFKPDHTTPNSVQDAHEVQLHFLLDSPAPWRVRSLAYWFTLPDRWRLHGLRKPALTHYVAPDPLACRDAGSTVVGLTVDAQGTPQSIRAVRGEASLAGAAVQAVRAWKFEPAAGSEQPVEAQAEVEFACQTGGIPTGSDAAPLPVYRVGGGVSAPVLLWKAEPEYSEEARKNKLQGTATLYIQISPEGNATEIQVVRMLGFGLDEKAMEAVKRWRFTPGNKDGKPVTVEANVEVNFRL